MSVLRVRNRFRYGLPRMFCTGPDSAYARRKLFGHRADAAPRERSARIMT
jgi:hypothetical protein